MSCPSSVTLSMYADGALSGRDAAPLERHAATCADCRARIAALREESAVLRASLRQVDELAPIPRFAPPPRPRDFVVLTLAVVLIGGFSKAFWNTLAAALPSELGWFLPLDSEALLRRARDAATFAIYEGPALWTAALNFVGATLVVVLLAWLAFSAARRRAFAGLAAALAAAVASAPPSPGRAFELRRDEALVSVAADETVDDTLLAMAETITIDGTVDGDVLAFGREVVVRGNVTGNLVTGAQIVTIEGTVGGTVLGSGETVSLANARVGRDLYGFGNTVRIAATANVSGNALAAANRIEVDGRVGNDFRGYGNSVAVGGDVEGDVEGHTTTLTLRPTARVGGDVTGHVERAGALNVMSGAVVGGAVNEELGEHVIERRPYVTANYYVRQIVRLGAAFLSGLLLLWLFPVLRSVQLPDAISVLRSGGIGLAAAVTLPVAAFILCITIVGLPLGILTFVLGALGLYFAKTIVAQIVGRGLLRNAESPPHFAATLFLGLVVVIVAINLPFVGGIINVALTLVGLGIIASLLLERLNRTSPP
jgi:cytoskeletal protein CcmA (bactofilin family)/anti-sigma factor RsiW